MVASRLGSLGLEPGHNNALKDKCERVEKARNSRNHRLFVTFSVAMASLLVTAFLTGYLKDRNLLIAGGVVSVLAITVGVLTRRHTSVSAYVQTKYNADITSVVTEFGLPEEQRTLGKKPEKVYDDLTKLEDRLAGHHGYLAAFSFLCLGIVGLVGYSYFQNHMESHRSPGPIWLQAIPGHQVHLQNLIEAKNETELANVVDHTIDQVKKGQQVLSRGNDVAAVLEDVERAVTAHVNDKREETKRYCVAALDRLANINQDLEGFKATGLPSDLEGEIKELSAKIQTFEKEIEKLKNGAYSRSTLTASQNEMAKAWNKVTRAIEEFLRALLDWLKNLLSQVPQFLQELGINILTDVLLGGIGDGSVPGKPNGKPGSQTPRNGGKPSGSRTKPGDRQNFRNALAAEFSRNPPILPRNTLMVQDGSQPSVSQVPNWREQPSATSNSGDTSPTKGGKAETKEKATGGGDRQAVLPPN